MMYRLAVTGAILLSAILANGCEGVKKHPPIGDNSRIGCYGVAHKGALIPPETAALCDSERIRKEIADRMDHEKLLYSSRTVVDRGQSFLEVPENVRNNLGADFTVARTPPEIEFAIIPAEPKFFAQLDNRDITGWWGNYAQSAFDPSTGRFYGAVGDHGRIGAHAYIVEYDPANRTVRCLPEVNRSLGRTKEQFGDGIIHGWLDFYKSTDLEKKHLWFCTYWSRFPEPIESDYATGYDGGHIISCDTATGDYVDYGAPLPRASWPYHRVDAKRGMLYAVGMKREFLAWDITTQRTRWAGFPPAGIDWHNRAILLDEQTGMVYTTNNADTDTLRHMIRYDPVANRFSLLKCHVPPDRETGKYELMRAQTRDRGPDGLFWGVTNTGGLFTFDPDHEEITDKGPCWPGDQRYTCSMERSPGGRFVYYAPQTYRDGSPIIQYDVKTGKKKVLAFLVGHYHGKYGYIPSVTYSLKLDPKGERLFMVWNGAFADLKPDIGVGRFGHCSVMLMHIPAAERAEDRM